MKVWVSQKLIENTPKLNLPSPWLVRRPAIYHSAENKQSKTTLFFWRAAFLLLSTTHTKDRVPACCIELSNRHLASGHGNFSKTVLFFLLQKCCTNTVKLYIPEKGLETALRNIDSAMRTVIFSTAAERYKKQWHHAEILNFHEIKSNFDWKMLRFNNKLCQFLNKFNIRRIALSLPFAQQGPAILVGFKGQGILIIFVLLKTHISAKIQYLITSISQKWLFPPACNAKIYKICQHCKTISSTV